MHIVQLLIIDDTMSGGMKQSTIRKAVGAIKDKTTVSLAKVHSDYKVYIHSKFIFRVFVYKIVDYSCSYCSDRILHSAGIGNQPCQGNKSC